MRTALPARRLRRRTSTCSTDTVEGVACAQERVFGVQYHPESAPGPQDSGYLFDRFIRLMEEGKDNA